MCDPCHGNTQTTSDGVKTRDVDLIIEELIKTVQPHWDNNSILGGVHLEQTGEFVTECLDGTKLGSEGSLGLHYRSLCDPRLSYIQAPRVIRAFVDFVGNQHA